MMACPDARTIKRALATMERLPAEALADLAERIIDRLDAAEVEVDLEEEHDCCPAGECGGAALRNDGLPGDPADAEPNGDEHEPDGDDEPDSDRDLIPPDEPLQGRLRGERDGFLAVHRRPFIAVTSRNGKPVRVETVVWVRRG